MTNKFGRTRNWTNSLRDEVIWDELRQVSKGWCIIAPIERYSGYTYLQKKRECCNHRCPDSVYFNTMLLVIHLRAIETLICRREISLIGSSFGFPQNTIHDCQNTELNS